MVACAYNYSTLGAEAGGLSKTLSKKVLGGVVMEMSQARELKF